MSAPSVRRLASGSLMPRRVVSCLSIALVSSVTVPSFVERDSSLFRREAADGLALDHLHQRLVRPAVRALPRLLRNRSGKERLRHADGVRPDRGRDDGRSILCSGREGFTQPPRDIDSLVETIDESLRQRAANVVVRKHLGRRVGELVRVEDLPLRPHGEGADQGKQRRKREERLDGRCALRRHRRLYGRARTGNAASPCRGDDRPPADR